MRRQINKRIRNEDLLEGCRQAFRQGFSRVKLYFMCGLPGGEGADLAGSVDVDALITGHTHKTVAGKVNDIPVVQAYYNGRSVGEITCIIMNA